MKAILTLFALTFIPIFLLAQEGNPVAIDDSVTKMQEVFVTQISFNVLENDYDPDGDDIRILEIRQPLHGSAGIEDSSISYQSDYLYYGEDLLKYRTVKLNDASAISNWASLSITILQNPTFPVAEDDHAQTLGGMSVTANLIQNDVDPEGDTLVLFSGFFGNFYGEVDILSDSIMKYTPYGINPGGLDTIIYYVKREGMNLPISKGYFIIDVTNSQFYDSLDINNISAGVNANGYLFNMYEDGSYRNQFTVPNGSGKNTIFGQSTWIGGMNNGELHLAGERYKQVGNDYWAGPVSNIYDTQYDIKWRRLWKLSKDEIWYHISHWADPGYVPIDNIATWPGNGNTANGQLEQIAPFYDNDLDGIYEPENGDYPVIRGDQAVFFIFNDARDVHTETQGESLGLEVHAMLYAYDDPEDSLLYNTVFGHFDYINTSEIDYDSVYIGLFTDFDIGYAWDDYLQCDVQRGSFIGYNGYDVDGTGQPGSYGEHPPAQSITILSGPYMDPNGIDDPDGGCDVSLNGINFGDGIADNERMGLRKFIHFFNTAGAQGDPLNAPDYYNYMKGYWKDNTRLLYGGYGHSSNIGTVGPECDFMFPYDTDTCNFGTGGVMPNGGFNQNDYYWNMEIAGNYPDDIRGLGSMGPFTFSAGMTQELDVAYVFARDYNGGAWESVELLKSRIDELIALVADGKIIPLPPGYQEIDDFAQQSSLLSIYPQPASTYINVDYTVQTEAAYYTVMDLTGKIVKSGKLQGKAQHQIDILDLKDGFYLIKLVDGRNKLLAKLIKI